MKLQILRAWLIALIICLLGLSAFPAWSQTIPGDMAVVRVNNFAETLDIIDEWGARSQYGPPVTQQLRALIGGTDWMDSTRSAIAMVTVDNDMPVAYAFLPFRKPSREFEQLVPAQTGPDYYLIAYPPNKPVPDNILRALQEESLKPTKGDSFFVEIPAAVYVNQMQTAMESMAMKAGKENPGPISEQDMMLMFDGVLDLFKQLDTIGIGVSITRSRAAISFEGRAIPGTQLAQIMAEPPEGEARLANYKAEGAIQYRSRPYDVNGFVTLLTKSLGPFYSKMGIDFNCFKVPMEEMTGEYVAGMSINKDSMDIEGIWCVKNPSVASVLVDQMIQCTVDMTKNNTQLAQIPGTAVWEATKDTKVAGLDVRGMRASIEEPIPGTEKTRSRTVDLRMTSQDGMVFMASSDAKIRRLVSKAKSLRPGRATGPLFTMDMDFGELMRLAAESDPQGKIPSNMPSTKMHVTMNTGGGGMRTEIAMDPNEIMALVRTFEPSALPGQPGMSSYSEPAKDRVVQPQSVEEPDYMEPEPTPEETLKQKVAGIVERGNLSAMYGGPKAAIKAYKEALKLDPNSPAANFAAALAYSELKEFQLALDYTDKALEFSPNNPVYIYGRARILLLSGQEEAAMVTFVEAANAGSVDAQNYLDHLSMEQ